MAPLFEGFAGTPVFGSTLVKTIPSGMGKRLGAPAPYTALFMNERPEKPYTLAFQHRAEYLHVTLRGRRENLEDSRDVWREIAEQCKAGDFKRVLLEKFLERDISIFEMLELVSEFPRLGLRSFKVAIVEHTEEHRELNKFAETAASNRGLLYRTFSSEQDAEQWLLAK